MHYHVYYSLGVERLHEDRVADPVVVVDRQTRRYERHAEGGGVRLERVQRVHCVCTKYGKEAFLHQLADCNGQWRDSVVHPGPL